MISRDQNQYRPDSVTSPGETLQETLDKIGMSQAVLAERTGRAKKTINEIIKGKAPITPHIALELEKVLGVPASFWNNYERLYRESLAKDEERKKLASYAEWAKQFPFPAMAKLGWVGKTNDIMERLQKLLRFLGIASPERWETLVAGYLGSGTAFRKSEVFRSDIFALICWLRKGELEADAVPCKVNRKLAVQISS